LLELFSRMVVARTFSPQVLFGTGPKALPQATVARAFSRDSCLNFHPFRPVGYLNLFDRGQTMRGLVVDQAVALVGAWLLRLREVL
jgi:hypothetical protein